MFCYQCEQTAGGTGCTKAGPGILVTGHDLPLSFILSWYEQKAVAILLTLLHLGVKGMRLGTSMPAFVTPNVFKIINDAYDLKPITTSEADLKEILG